MYESTVNVIISYSIESVVVLLEIFDKISHETSIDTIVKVLP